MPRELQVVIADDELFARERLKTLLQEQRIMTRLVGEVVDGQHVVQTCLERHPDVVLLDIAMPGTDGLTVARRLCQLEPQPAVIFCTAYDQHALSAFDVQAIDYLMKPIRSERLAAALQRVLAFLEGRKKQVVMSSKQRSVQTRTHLYVRLRGTVRLIPLHDVHYLQAEEKYVMVYHAHGHDLIEESLKSLEETCPNFFVRIHRNCLIAHHELAALRRDGSHVYAVLRHASVSLDVSRRCVAALRERLRLSSSG